MNSSIYKVFLLLMGDQIFCFFSDSNTDSESEKIMNLLFLDSEMKSRAMLIAQGQYCCMVASLGF